MLRQDACLKIGAVSIKRIKVSAYKKVVSRIGNGRVKGIIHKCGLQKGCEQLRIKIE